MIILIKLFLLKRKIRYKQCKEISAYKSCYNCLTFKGNFAGNCRTDGICNRFKFKADVSFICSHFVPKNYNKPISVKDQAEIESFENWYEGFINDISKQIGDIK